MSKPASSFAEIVGVIAAIQPLKPVPESAIGSAPDLVLWLGQVQGRLPPRLNRPRLAIFAAPHGHQPVDMPALLAPWQNGSALAVQLLAAQGGEADLQVYEMASHLPTGDITQGPALTESAAAHAMAYGMMVAEAGIDLLLLSTADDAATGTATGANVSALAVICALLKREPDEFNLDSDVTSKIEAALQANRASMTDPLTILATLGGYESCAILGAILAAQLGSMPVLVEGLPALAAVLTLGKLAGREVDARDLLLHVRATDCLAGLRLEVEKFVTLVPAPTLAPEATMPARLAGAGCQAAATLASVRAWCGTPPSGA